MRRYFKHLGWIYITVIVLLIVYGIASITNKEPEVTYTRTNSECLTLERVFDMADVLSDSEEESLRMLIQEKEDEIGCDIVLVTISEDVSNMMVYADDFYDNNKYGYNKPWGDGAIYVDNWKSGDVWFSTCGRVEDRYSSAMIDRLIDKVCDKVNDDPYGAYRLYVESMAYDMKHASGMQFKESTKYGAVGFSFIVSLVFLLMNLFGSKGKKTTAANTYVEGNTPNIRRKEDLFVTKHVSKRRIESSSSSGGGGGGGHHISGGGISHGGGGGHH